MSVGISVTRSDVSRTLSECRLPSLHRLGADDTDDVGTLRGALAGLVATALAQRDGRDTSALSELERTEIETEKEGEEEEEEENIYSYEGKDYSGGKGGEKSEEDERALRELVGNSTGAGPSGRGTASKRRPRSAEGEGGLDPGVCDLDQNAPRGGRLNIKLRKCSLCDLEFSSCGTKVRPDLNP